GRVDVFVDHDHVTAEVRAGVHLRGGEHRLARVAGIALLDGDDVEQSSAAGFVAPHAFDVGNAGLFDLLPDQRCFHHAFRDRIIRRRTARTRAAENRVVAVVDIFHTNHRLGPAGAGIVAGPLAERAFGLAIVGIHPAFDDDLGVGGKRQPGGFAFDDFDRRAFETAGVIEFRYAVVDLVAGNHEQHRILADGDDHGAALAALEIFIALNAAVFARRDVKTHGVLVVHHAAVGAEVDPAFIGIARGHQAGGADEPAAVELVHKRHGEFQQIDLVAGVDVLEDRAFAHDFMLDRL